MELIIWDRFEKSLRQAARGKEEHQSEKMREARKEWRRIFLVKSTNVKPKADSCHCDSQQ